MKIDDSYTNYAFTFIKDICEQFGPRYSASEAELKANLWIKKELSKFCDETFLEEFETHPNLYPGGIIKICGVFGFIAFLFLPFKFPFPLFSGVLVFLGLFVLFTELVLMKGWIKFLFRKGTSSNVFGLIKPSGEVKFRIIFEGHTDSAKQMKLAEDRLPIFRFGLGIFYLFYTLLFSLVKFLAQIFWGAAIMQFSFGFFQWTILDWFYFLPWLILYPSFLFLFLGLASNLGVMGANDNLSGSAVSAALGKYFSTNRPQHVELIIASMGSEEVGSKGAKHFVENHGDLLQNSYAFVFDSVGAGQELYIIERDFMHLTKYSSEVVDRIGHAYKLYQQEHPEAVPCSKGNLPLGSSDACRYSRAGYHASFLIAVAGGLKKPAHWHVASDTWQNIDKKVLKDVIGIAIHFVTLVDQEFVTKEP